MEEYVRHGTNPDWCAICNGADASQSTAPARATAFTAERQSRTCSTTSAISSPLTARLSVKRQSPLCGFRVGGSPLRCACAFHA